MSRYLVIGGNGVIGNFVTRQLVEQGHRPLVISPSGRSNLIADVRDRCDVAKGDVTDAAGLAEIIRAHRITHIAHLGAPAPAVTEPNPQLGVRAAVEGTVNLLEAARLHGVKRIVMASSKAVYGPLSGDFAYPTYRPVSEDKEPQPASVNGIAYLAAELLGRWYNQNHGVEFIALRFGSTVGPGKLRRAGGSISGYGLIIESAMAGKPVNIPKGGDGKTDTVFNEDVARGFICAFQAPTPQHDVFNIATGVGITMRDFAAAVKRRYPAAAISIGPGHEYLPPHLTGHCVLDVSRAQNELGYAPNADVDRMVAAYSAAMQRLKLEPSVT